MLQKGTKNEIYNSSSAVLYWHRVLFCRRCERNLFLCLITDFLAASNFELSLFFAELFHDVLMIEELALKKYEPALNVLHTMAGSVQIAFKLGEYYYYGHNGYQQNYDQAWKWFHMAASSHCEHAFVYIGVMLQNGLGVKKNQLAAAKWFLQANSTGVSKLKSQSSCSLFYYSL